MSNKLQYPALYDAANTMSASAQNEYLWLIKIEYALLFVASVLSLNFYSSSGYYAVYAFVFIVSLCIMIARTWKKPEQDWYKGRALAESIKTSCWRYCMRAQPFGNEDSEEVTRDEFRTHLMGILSVNHALSDKISPDSAADDQITASMDEVRALNLEERIKYYRAHRIRDQQVWYRDKAKYNKKLSKRWNIIAIVIYTSAIAMVLARISWSNIEFWPIEPVIVIASTIMGWTQVKKFNELSSSYTLTAHEIGLTISVSNKINDEGEFSKFVLEAEQAFSREHTQWIARQTFQ